MVGSWGCGVWGPFDRLRDRVVMLLRPGGALRQAQGPDCDAVMVWGRPSTGSGTEW